MKSHYKPRDAHAYADRKTSGGYSAGKAAAIRGTGMPDLTG
jgi:hypothetical protein